MEARFGKQDLLSAMEKAGKEHPKLNIPHSYRSLIRLEKARVIPECGQPLQFKSGRSWRLYTQDEIDTIVAKIIQYKKEKRLCQTP